MYNKSAMGDFMENKINIVGNISDLNTTIIGASQAGKTNVGKSLQSLGYYYLGNDNLKALDLNTEEIKAYLNITKYNEATKKQNLVLANIIELIKNGYKKIVIDDLLTLVDSDIRKALLNIMILKDIKFVNITMDIEDTLLTDYLIVVFNNEIALEGQTLEVLKEEKILKRMGLSLPFIIDLSIQLKYYGLVDKIFLNKEELVSELWK